MNKLEKKDKLTFSKWTAIGIVLIIIGAFVFNYAESSKILIELSYWFVGIGIVAVLIVIFLILVKLFK